MGSDVHRSVQSLNEMVLASHHGVGATNNQRTNIDSSLTLHGLSLYTKIQVHFPSGYELEQSGCGSYLDFIGVRNMDRVNLRICGKSEMERTIKFTTYQDTITFRFHKRSNFYSNFVFYYSGKNSTLALSEK